MFATIIAVMLAAIILKYGWDESGFRFLLVYVLGIIGTLEVSNKYTLYKLHKKAIDGSLIFEILLNIGIVVAGTYLIFFE